jgi:hypothetical protein
MSGDGSILVTGRKEYLIGARLFQEYVYFDLHTAYN